jgi:hypothetical protein
MSEGWTPELAVRDVAGRCRLGLGGQIHGEGATLQDAADDLIRRLLAVSLALRTDGFRVSAEAPGLDLRWFEFLYELGSIAAGGGDIRDRVFARAA